MPTYTDFTLTIYQAHTGYELTAHGPGEIAVPPQPIPPELSEQLATAISQFQHGDALPVEQMESIGKLLYRVLFPPSIAAAYAAAQQVVAPEGHLRLRLAIYPPELNALPWELLYHPEQKRFLAALLTQPLVRYIESATPVASLYAEKPLHLLYVQSMPADLPPLDLEASERSLRQALGVAAEITTLRQPTRQALQNALRQPFHALHYDGHAFFDEAAGSSALMLTDEQGNATALSGADLAYDLAGTSVRMVMLAACQSGMDARRARFSGIAHELMKASNLPAVIAMQASISDGAAIAFTCGFYHALADEYPLDAATTEGRKAILAAAGGEFATSEWATPVLFLRGAGQIFAIPEDAPAPGEPPYKGLQYFDETDTDLFFGRTELSQTLADRLRAERFLAVVGASGSGKSSVVRAGLLPKLRQAGGWTIVSPFTPAMGSEPLLALANAVLPLLEPDLSELDCLAEAKKLTTHLRDGDLSLREVAGRILQKQGAARLALVVDQFEELFTTFREKTALQSEFVNVLLAAVEADSPVSVVITLRADFYAPCAQYAGLRAALENHQAFIGPMNAGELRQAIEQPARLNDWQLEDGLVEMLLRDVGDEPGNLPLLSHALLETWQRRKGRTLTLQGYQQSGGVQGAIARTADAVIHGLNAEQQAVARRIFLGLTELGEGTQDTRRRAALDEIAPQADMRLAVDAVIKTLADARLVTTSDQSAEVAHEALIREWPTLRRWLDEDRSSLRLHRELNEDAREWANLNRDAGALYRGARLAAAAEWTEAHRDEMTPLEGEFLQASQQAVEQEALEREAQRQRELEQAQRLAKTQRQRTIVLTAGLAVALVLVGVALWFMRSANINLGQANTAGTQAAENLLSARQNAATATHALGLSEQRGTQAAEQAATAEAASTQAVAQQSTAEAERVRAEEQARIAFSRQLAAQAQQIFGTGYQRQPLAVLLAIHSYEMFPSLEAVQILQNHTLALPVARMTHDGPVSAVAYSPDGKYVASGSDDGTARVWEVSSGKEMSRFTHEASVTSVTFSPDGLTVVTGSDDKTVQVWDAFSGKEIARMTHLDRLNFVALSSDGKLVASSEGCEQGDPEGFYCVVGGARVWEAATGREIMHITQNAPITSAAFSPNGNYLVSGDGDGIVRVWEIATGQETVSMTHGIWVSSVAFSPDGDHIAAGGCERSPAGTCVQGSIRLWFSWYENWSEVYEEIQINHPYNVDSITFSPDGRRLLSRSGEDGSARLWDLDRVQEIFHITPDDGMGAIAFSADGRSLVSHGRFTGRVWDASNGQEIACLDYGWDADVGVTSAVFSPDGKYIVSGSIDGAVRVWQADRGQFVAYLDHGVEALTFRMDSRLLVGVNDTSNIRMWDLANKQEIVSIHPEISIRSVAFSPDGQYVAIQEYAGDTVRILETASGKEIAHMTHTDTVLSISYSPDGAYIATASSDGTARVWEAASGKETARMTYPGDVSLVTFSPDGKRVASYGCGKSNADGCLEDVISIWEATSGQEIARLPQGGLTTRIVFSPDGKRIASGGCDYYQDDYWGCMAAPSAVHLWDIATGQELARMTHERGIHALAFSPDGRYIISGGDHTARVWEALSGTEIARMNHEGEINSVAFSPDGQYVISGSSDNTARVWVAATGQEIARMTHGGSVISVAFSPDGKYAASGSEDGEFSEYGIVRVWPYLPADLITAACLRLPRDLTQSEWQQYFPGEAYRKTCPNLPDAPTPTAIPNP